MPDWSSSARVSRPPRREPSFVTPSSVPDRSMGGAIRPSDIPTGQDIANVLKNIASGAQRREASIIPETFSGSLRDVSLHFLQGSKWANWREMPQSIKDAIQIVLGNTLDRASLPEESVEKALALHSQFRDQQAQEVEGFRTRRSLHLKPLGESVDEFMKNQFKESPQGNEAQLFLALAVTQRLVDLETQYGGNLLKSGYDLAKDHDDTFPNLLSLAKGFGFDEAGFFGQFLGNLKSGSGNELTNAMFNIRPENYRTSK